MTFVRFCLVGSPLWSLLTVTAYSHCLQSLLTVTACWYSLQLLSALLSLLAVASLLVVTAVTAINYNIHCIYILCINKHKLFSCAVQFYCYIPLAVTSLFTASLTASLLSCFASRARTSSLLAGTTTHEHYYYYYYYYNYYNNNNYYYYY